MTAVHLAGGLLWWEKPGWTVMKMEKSIIAKVVVAFVWVMPRFSDGMCR
jgi:hypothetical protein